MISDESVTVDKDRSNFFKFVFDSSISFPELLTAYMSYHGPLFHDQRRLFRKRLSDEIFRSKLNFDVDQIVLPDDTLNRQILLDCFPTISDLYYEEVKFLGEPKEILAAGSNELVNTDLPIALNLRSGRKTRPALTAFRVSGKYNLLVGPNQHQLIEPSTHRMFPQICNRPLPRSIENYQSHALKETCVLIQDAGDGTNFAHFLFDYVTRILHLANSDMVDFSRSIFVMGGKSTDFHKLVVTALCRELHVRTEQFLFPQNRFLLTLQSDLIYFSDQKLARMHPAQMAHPSSIALLDELCRSIVVDSGKDERVYISRRDAKLRRVSNELELIAIARKHRFRIVEMAELNVLDQIALVKGAAVIVGPHGMGLTHVAFSTRPTRLLELFHPTIGTDAYSMIARARNIQYNFLIGIEEDDGRASYSINPQNFENALTSL